MSVLQNSKSETIRRLREQLQKFRPQRREPQASGCAVLDRVLPGGGVPCGGIVEWLGDTGDGAVTLSLWMAQRLCRDEGTLAVVDGRRQLYPPAMAALGVDLDRTLLVHPQSRRDEIWSLVQCLRCPSVAVVWGCLGRLDAREYRCLQLAAETSGVTGMFTRPTGIRGEPTWADVQLLVTPQASAGGFKKRPQVGRATKDTLPFTSDSFSNRRFVVEVVHCRQGASGKSVTIDMDAITGEPRKSDETFPKYLASQLAHPPAGRRAARA